MPPNTHAILSPSSADRWLHCTRSAKLELEFSEKESDAAVEGTAAHALCEHKVKKALKQRSRRPVSAYDSNEMEELTDAYRDYVLEQLTLERQNCPDAQVFIETRLDLTSYVPGSFGTCDCLIVSDEKLHIIDFKYGQGVLVEAKENPQMKLYALGALDIYDGLYDFKEVAMTIFQPRRENVSTWTETVEELRRWAEEELKPKAELADAGEGEFCSGDWCLFCKAAVKCRARAQAKLELAKQEFSLPPIITDEEIEEILPRLPDLTKWANDIMAYATDAALNHGKQWKGFKVVEGRSVRKYSDEDAVIKAAKDAGYTDIFKTSLITLTEMEKLMGKKKFKETLGGLIVKPQGKPTLVPDSDKRSAITGNDAKSDFKKITEVM
jgi:hypothetical protein